MRYLIYFVYDEKGRVQDYVPVFLQSVRDRYDVIHVVYNGEIVKEDLAKLDIADKVQQRPNDEFDVGAYKAALFSNPDAFYADCEELALANFTFLAPIGDMGKVFDWADAQDVEFWGLSAHRSMRPNPFTGKGKLPFHINSHWISVGNRMLRDPAFFAYWRGLPKIESYIDSVLKHESQFTQHFAKRGYRYATFMDCDRYPSDYPAFNDIAKAVRDGFPILKRRLFYHTPTTYLDQHDVNLRSALDHVNATGAYDPDLIWGSFAGTVDPGVLYNNADLLEVVADDRAAPLAKPDGVKPVQVVMLISGRIEQEALASALGHLQFDCHLHVTGDSEETLIRAAEWAAGATQVKSCETDLGGNIIACFSQIAEGAGRVPAAGEPVLFLVLDQNGLPQFSYGMRHVARDAAVVARARGSFDRSRYFGLALPAIRTYGKQAETEYLNDESRNEALTDLRRFGIRAQLEGHVLLSNSGVYWIRSGLLVAVARRVVEWGNSNLPFPDAAGALAAPLGLTDGKEIETFLALGLPYCAAEQGLITFCLTNTAEIPRNFVKIENRYRHISERIGERDPFLVKNRFDYLLQFNTHEGRQAIFSDVHTQAYQEGWKAASSRGWSDAFQAGRSAARQDAPPPEPAPPEPDPEEGQRAVQQMQSARAESYEMGYRTGWEESFNSGFDEVWKAAFEKGYEEGWKQSGGLSPKILARAVYSGTRRRVGRVIRKVARRITRRINR